MKKARFYSQVNDNGHVAAHIWDGWTDGEYCYYKYKSMWRCIEPKTGLSVGSGETRAIARTFADLSRDRIAQYRQTQEYAARVSEFSELCAVTA